MSPPRAGVAGPAGGNCRGAVGRGAPGTAGGATFDRGKGAGMAGGTGVTDAAGAIGAAGGGGGAKGALGGVGRGGAAGGAENGPAGIAGAFPVMSEEAGA